MGLSCLSDITNTFYINLEHRSDRKEHVETQLTNIGLHGTRFNAIKMADGAIGCSMSHLKLLQMALEQNLDHILIVEDDITFTEPTVFQTQINNFFKLHPENTWDVLLIAGNNMPPYEVIDDTCVKVSSCQTTTGYLVNGHYIQTLITNIKTGLTHLLHKNTEKRLFAIDKYWFLLQKIHNWFLLVPLTVVQREDYSDIEKRHTNYISAMTDLDKKDFFMRYYQKSCV